MHTAKVLGALAAIALALVSCSYSQTPEAMPANPEGRSVNAQAMQVDSDDSQSTNTDPADSKPRAPEVTGTPLPRDPRNTYVTLDNGFQIVVRPNAEPPGRAEFNLHVDTGALNETTAQNGLAHFLEHMAFNGSTHFEPGTLVPQLDKLGMQFGADSNAHTNHYETVYKLSMPDTKEETIDLALRIFSDYAYGLLLLEEEINSERGIIANEKTANKGVQMRLREKFFENVFAGTRIALHDVIGKDEVIGGAPRTEFVDYYDTWYRPDLMTLVVVGDVDPKSIVKKARALFSEEQFTPRAVARQAGIAAIQPLDEARAVVYSDRELPIAQIQVLGIEPGRMPMTTVEAYRENEIENIGPWIVNRRLADRLQRGEANYLQASSAVQAIFDEAIMPAMTGFSQPSDWQAMLTQIIAEVDRALEHGFTEQELELARKNMLAVAEQQVEAAETRDSGALVGMLSSQIGLDMPMLSEAQQLELVRDVASTMTVEEVHASFKEHFDRDAYFYVLALPDSAPKPKPEEILSIASSAWSAETDEVEESGEAEPILTELPKPGSIESQSSHEATGVTNLVLSNGAVLHHRYMDERKNQASIAIVIPGGSIEETAETRGLADAASLIGATSRLTSSEIRDMMIDKTVSLGGGFQGLDTCQFVVSGPTDELADGLQLLHAFIQDGKIEKTTFEPWRTQRAQAMEVEDRQAGTHLTRAISRTFLGGDPRLAPMTREQLDALTISDAEAFAQHIKGRPIEISFVGDITLENARPIIEQYLATLPEVKSKGDPLKDLRTMSYEPGPYVETVEFETDTDQAVVFVGYRGASPDETNARRQLQVASTILTNRMVKRIREEKQLVYSIGASYQHGDAIDGTSQLFAAGPCQPENSEALATEIEAMFQDFALNGPTDEEMNVAQGQFRNRIAEAKEVPGTWLRWLSDLEYRGRSLDDLAKLETIYSNFSRDEVHQAVKDVVKNDRFIRVIARPATAPN